MLTKGEAMARVKSKDTHPEKAVRSTLHRMGYRFRLHQKDLPGTPDIVLKKYKTAIFVHGCFWHQHAGCKKSQRPKTRTSFWDKKLNRNIKRDKENIALLKKMGWKVIIIWECQTQNKEEIKDLLLRQLPLRSDTSHSIGST